MPRFYAVTLACALAVLPGSASCAARTAVTAEEALNWKRYVVPLPKSINILGKIQVECTKVAIVIPSSSDVKVPQARKELRQTLGLSDTGDNPADPAFTITLQLGGAESAGLASLANSDQAYRILVEPGDTGLRLVALDPYGLYYAAKTLQLMLAPKVSAGSVQMPIMEVLDWPDMTDRGLWGCDHFLWLKWMGDRKMNIGEQISAREVRSDLKGYSYLKAGRETMITEGPYYGVKPVPVVLHLEQVWSTGLFTYYPQLIGVGGQYGCICYSNGAFTNVLTDWLCDLASLPFVEGVDVWMAENLHGQGGCQCAQCKTKDRSVLEAETIVAAWENAKARLGRYFNLWILTSEETYNSNTAVFNSLPSDVRIWYYHSLYTYTAGRTPMIPNNVQNVANSGRYAGVCPSLSYIGCTQPFQSAEFVHYRMNEFVDKKLRGFIGYATPPPLVNFVGYNVEAAAEWSWNAKGRTPREFAISYAVRKGLSDPEKFAEWADAIGKLEFDLYGSEWPACEGKFWPGYVADLLRKGTLPALGTAYAGARGPWGEFKSAQQLDDDVVLAAKAVALAREMGIREYYYESLYADGLITALRALHKLRSLVVGGTVTPANREIARYYFGVYINSLKQSIEAVTEWSKIVSGTSSWVATVVGKLQKGIYGEPGTNNPGMLQVAIDCGCNPTLPYHSEPAITIAKAKERGQGALVKLYGKLVTGSHGTTCFLQEPDRSAAIRVRTPGSVTPLAPAAIFGRVDNVDGELVVNAEVSQSAGSAESVAPLAVSMRNLAGGEFGGQPAVMEYRWVVEGGKQVKKPLPAVGLNNLGLFVRVSGWVTFVGPNYFYVDDGSACDDGSGHTGVRAIYADASWPKPPVGEYVIVDCMSSSYFERGLTWRAVYVTHPGNVTIVSMPLEIVMDEDDATFTGGWTYATSPGGAYEDDYKYTLTAATRTATARWTPLLPRTGNYDVYVMYAHGQDHTTAAPYTINFDGGSQTYLVNQTSDGGKWQLLGNKFFSSGKSGFVELGNATADAGKLAVADAVKFVFAGAGFPPSITSQPADQVVCAGGNASFAVTASGSSPLVYQWRRGTANIANGGRFSGANTPVLLITGCHLSDAAPDYNCVVSNSYGIIPTNNAALIVGDPTAVPTALPASNIGTDTITWNWSSVPGATGYKLWTAAAGGTQIGGTITGTSYTETKLDPGTSYTRYVEVWSGCGASVSRTQLGPTSTLPRYCVENGDFEGGFTGGIGNGWTKGADDGTSTFARETTIVRDGSSSQRLRDPVGGQAFTAWLYQKINVQPNRGYTYKVWNRREVTGGCVVSLGVNYTGGITPDVTSQTMGSGAGIWSLKSVHFTSGATGLVTVMFCAGQNKSDTTAYVDGVFLVPRAPTTTGGSTTISAGGSATITASGGFGGNETELHWYTGPGGTGTHVGTGTSLNVSPAVTTTYYPRWEPRYCSGTCCVSDDGPAVTITVTP